MIYLIDDTLKETIDSDFVFDDKCLTTMQTLTSILSTPESSYLEGKSAKGGFPDFVKEEYDRTFLKLPTFGKEPDKNRTYSLNINTVDK